MFSSLDTTKVINLIVLSKINVGDKLSTRNRQFVIESPSYLYSITRWLRFETRDQMVEAVDSLVTDCIDNVSRNRVDLDKLADLLKKASVGVNNLMQTYNQDKTIVAGLEFILSKMNYFLVLNGFIENPIEPSKSSNSLEEELVN